MKQLSIILLFFFISLNFFAQSKLNAYKYVLIPRQFEKFGEDDKYQLNSLSVFEFKKLGFESYLEGESLPQDMINNPCQVLHMRLQDDSNLFTSKVYILLDNCQKSQVFKSEMGRSKEKDYRRSYQAALRDAFASLEAEEYVYNSDLAIASNPAPSVPAKVERTEVPVVLIDPVPVVSPTDEVSPVLKTEEVKPVSVNSESYANTYGNDRLSFLLIPTDFGYQAYVSESKVDYLKKGQVLGTFRKTSLPNVFMVSWKGENGETQETTGYFDDKDQLKVDVQENGSIKTSVFKKE